jgi:hypothetical protein
MLRLEDQEVQPGEYSQNENESRIVAETSQLRSEFELLQKDIQFELSTCVTTGTVINVIKQFQSLS